MMIIAGLVCFGYICLITVFIREVFIPMMMNSNMNENYKNSERVEK